MVEGVIRNVDICRKCGMYRTVAGGYYAQYYYEKHELEIRTPEGRISWGPSEVPECNDK